MTPVTDFGGADTVLLDMDGTLLDLHFDNYFWQQVIPETYALRHGHRTAAARERVFEMYRERLGTLDWYCLDHWSDVLGIDIVALKRRHLDRVCLLPGVREFLTALRRCGLRTIIATNAHGTTLALKRSVTDLDSSVDEIHSSFDYGAAKEQALFWERFRDRVGFDPDRTLFVDDNPAVLAAARAFGVGQLVGIRQPDSTRPPVPLEGFPCVDGVRDLLPALAVRVPR